MISRNIFWMRENFTFSTQCFHEIFAYAVWTVLLNELLVNDRIGVKRDSAETEALARSNKALAEKNT